MLLNNLGEFDFQRKRGLANNFCLFSAGHQVGMLGSVICTSTRKYGNTLSLLKEKVRVL